MTVIENDNPKIAYEGPFTEGQLLPLTFPFVDKDHVKLIIDGVQKTINIDYEVMTESDPEEGVSYPNSVYIKEDLPEAIQATIYRETPLDQQADFPQNGKFRSERIEQALDKICMEQQEQEEMLSRCIVAPITLKEFNGQLPDPAPDQALKWDAEGKTIENYDIIGNFEAFQEEVHTEMDEYQNAVDQKFDNFSTDVNQRISDFQTGINNTFTEYKNTTDAAIDAFKLETNSNIREFKNTVNTNITDFQTATNTDINEFKGEVNTKLADMTTTVNDNTALSNRALTTSERALTNSNTGIDTANAALEKSGTALNTANNALTNAAHAVEVANNTMEQADIAEAAASSAAASAASAEADAANALSQIEEAVTKAEAAKQAADGVTDTANKAAADAANALSQIEEAVTKADAVYGLATDANTKATAAEAAANSVVADVEALKKNGGFPITFGMWATRNPGFGTMVANEDIPLPATTYPETWELLNNIYNGTVKEAAVPVMTLAEYQAMCGTDRADLAGLCNGRCGEAAFYYIIDPDKNEFYLPVMLPEDRLMAGDYCPTVISGNIDGNTTVALNALGCYWQNGMLFTLSPRSEERTVKKFAWRADSEMVQKTFRYHVPFAISAEATEIPTELVLLETQTVEDQPGYSKPVYRRQLVTPLDIPFAYTLLNENYSFACRLLKKTGTTTAEDGSEVTVLDDTNLYYMGWMSDSAVSKTRESISVQLNFFDTQSEHEWTSTRENELLITEADGSKYGVIDYTLVGVTHVPPVADYTTDLRLYIKLA